MITKISKTTLGGVFVLVFTCAQGALSSVPNQNNSPILQPILVGKSVSAVPRRISTAPSRSEACPLNSGGPTLVGSKWRLNRIYSTIAPKQLDITMLVSSASLIGFSGCNKYAAGFKRIGLTGFKVTTIHKTQQACAVKRMYKSGPTINVGDWEGQYLKTIRRMGSVQKNGDRLDFYDRNGKVAMVFEESQ